jgi:hypothetical protein
MLSVAKKTIMLSVVTDTLKRKKCGGHLGKSPGAETSFLKRRIKLDVTSPRDVTVTFVVHQFNLFEER